MVTLCVIDPDVALIVTCDVVAAGGVELLPCCGPEDEQPVIATEDSTSNNATSEPRATSDLRFIPTNASNPNGPTKASVIPALE